MHAWYKKKARPSKPRLTWPVWFGLAVLILIGAHLVLPNLFPPAPYTQPLLKTLRTLADGLAALAALGAVLSFIQARRAAALAATPAHVRAKQEAQRRHQQRQQDQQAKKKSQSSSAAPPALDPVAPSLPDTHTWSLPLLQHLEWKRFEELCAAYYQEKDILCQSTPLGPDGGIDLRLYQDRTQPQRLTGIVQCKATRTVGIKPMREMLGVKVHHQLDTCFFMTSGVFTDEAKAFGQQNRIMPIDGKLFLAMIRRLPAPRQQHLLQLATQGDWHIPTCPRCGKKMQRRDPPGKKPFWACPRGRCTGRLEIRHERR